MLDDASIKGDQKHMISEHRDILQNATKVRGFDGNIHVRICAHTANVSKLALRHDIIFCALIVPALFSPVLDREDPAKVLFTIIPNAYTSSIEHYTDFLNTMKPTKTSENSPLEIDFLEPENLKAPDRIGLSIAPGKHDEDSGAI